LVGEDGKTHDMRDLPEFKVERLAARRSLTERVTDALGILITSHDYPPGSQLPTENELAAHFGVSRTVVREAVARLKSAGLVESRQGSGVYVREPNAEMLFRIDPAAIDASADSVLPIVELRRGVEVEAAALAAERCTRARIGEIRTALAGIARAEAAGEDGVDADMRFHRAIVRATGNPHYLALWDFIGQFIRGAMRTTRANEAQRADFAAQVRSEHRAIVEAIGERSPPRARKAALRHSEMSVVRLRESGMIGQARGRTAPADARPARRDEE
jgi:GntR family transcriptional repressor for pyruvate dehydrogenase complex